MKKLRTFWVILAGMVLLSISIEPNSRLGFAASSVIGPQALNQPAASCSGNSSCSGSNGNSPSPADTTPPDTEITSNPPNPTNSTYATFSFLCWDAGDPLTSRTEGTCTYDCQLDSGGWTPCTSPKTTSGLSEGSHTFQVQAWDSAGNVDPNPASFAWTICINDCWIPTSIGANLPSERYNHTAIWTGSEMIVWGGKPTTYSGGKYNPVTDSWTSTSTGTNVPEARYSHSAVWTGSLMIVWGGWNGSSRLNTGGNYDPAIDSWTPTSTGTNVPEARRYHTAVWTGSEMIIWGGEKKGHTAFPPEVCNNGGRYNPIADTWTSTGTGTNVPEAREFHTAVWTGSEIIIWGGYNIYVPLNTGGRYNPATDSWTATNIGTDVPSARQLHAAIWTTSEMIIWGGSISSSPVSTNTGGRYNPTTDSWTPTSTGSNVPSARYYHTAVWTNSEMIIWGGHGSSSLNTGGRYNPSTDSWVPTSTGTTVPSGREYHIAVWTGSEMIVWGGSDGTSYFNTGGIYTP